MSTLSVATINTANTTTDLTMKTGNTSGGSIVITSQSAGMILQSNSITNAVTISATANVGINNTAPTNTLSINGSTYLGGALVSSGNVVSGGFAVNSYNIGTTTVGGTITPSPTNGNYQYLQANTTWTLAVPGSDCAIDILVTNGTAANTITISGSYTAPSGGGGDTYAVTSGNKYLLFVRRINGISTYSWKALQ